MKTILKNSKCIVEYNPEAKHALDFFDGRDLTDSNNEPAFYSKTMRSHKKAWAALQADFNDFTTMYGAIGILNQNGIKCHSYCAMD